MSLLTYKILHILGLVVLMLGLGAVLGAGRDKGKGRRLGVILHGVGLLVMIVAGFGLMARIGYGGLDTWPVWLMLKMGIWVLIAVLPVLVKREVIPGVVGWLIAAGLATAAAWLAVTKPFVG